MAGALWEEFLQTASWGGAEFEIVSAQDEYGRTIDRINIPYTDGQQLDDRARDGNVITERAVFIEDDYPDKMNALLAKVAEGGVRELIHPVFGSIQAGVLSAKVTHDAEDGRDVAYVDIVFLEHTESAIGPFQATDTLPALASAVRAACDDVVTAAAALQDYIDSLSPAPAPAVAGAPVAATSAAGDASAAADDLETNADQLSVADVQSRVNSVLSELNGVSNMIDNYTALPTYTLGANVNALAAALGRLGSSIIEAKPPLITDTVAADAPLLTLAHAWYGDSSRAAELAQLNPIADPLLVPRGTTLRRYAA